MPQDTVLFIGAYNASRIKKELYFKRKRPSFQDLLKKYHLEYVATDKRMISLRETMDVTADYDDIRQCTKFSFESHKQCEPEEAANDFKHWGFYMSLRHAYVLLEDAAYFRLEYTFLLKPFWVWIEDAEYQADAGAFVMNNTLIVVFEMIDTKTKKPLSKDDVGAKIKNYNLVPVNKYRFSGDEKESVCNKKIPNIIAGNIADFLWELVGKKFIVKEYGYVYDIAVFSNNISNVNDYLCKLIGVKQPVSEVRDVSTVDTYEYYPQDGVSITTNYAPEDINIVMYNILVLESIKMYIYLFQNENLRFEEDLKRLVKNHLYLQNLFCSPRVPIETNNLLKYIRESESYRMNEEGVTIKIAYMREENERQKNRNAVVLSVLLYFASLLGAVATLDTLESHLGLPFCAGLIVIIVVFALGLLWYIREYLNNRHS